MNDLIQQIKILDQHEVDELNLHIDTLQFKENLVFDVKSQGTKVDKEYRTSTGAREREKVSEQPPSLLS